MTRCRPGFPLKILRTTEYGIGLFCGFGIANLDTRYAMPEHGGREAIPARRWAAVRPDPLSEVLTTATGARFIAIPEIPPQGYAGNERSVFPKNVPAEKADPAAYGPVEVEFRHCAIG